MWIFVSILFLIGTVHFVLNLSLVKRNWVRLVLIFGIALLNFLAYPLSMKINISRFTQILNNYNLLSLVCTAQVMESFVILIATGYLIKLGTEGTSVPSWMNLALSPSPIFIAGLFALQTGMLHLINGNSFEKTSIWTALGIILVLTLGSLVFRFMTRTDEFRLELKIYLSVLQLLLAMFLPMIITDGTIEATQFQIEPIHILSVWGTMLLVSLAGYYLTRRKASIVSLSHNLISKILQNKHVTSKQVIIETKG